VALPHLIGDIINAFLMVSSNLVLAMKMRVDRADITFFPNRRESLPENLQQRKMNAINVREKVYCSHVFQ
jgi:hypothetical protein